MKISICTILLLFPSLLHVASCGKSSSELSDSAASSEDSEGSSVSAANSEESFTGDPDAFISNVFGGFIPSKQFEKLKQKAKLGGSNRALFIMKKLAATEKKCKQLKKFGISCKTIPLGLQPVLSEKSRELTLTIDAAFGVFGVATVVNVNERNERKNPIRLFRNCIPEFPLNSMRMSGGSRLSSKMPLLVYKYPVLPEASRTFHLLGRLRFAAKKKGQKKLRWLRPFPFVVDLEAADTGDAKIVRLLRKNALFFEYFSHSYDVQKLRTLLQQRDCSAEFIRKVWIRYQYVLNIWLMILHSYRIAHNDLVTGNSIVTFKRDISDDDGSDEDGTCPEFVLNRIDMASLKFIDLDTATLPYFKQAIIDEIRVRKQRITSDAFHMVDRFKRYTGRLDGKAAGPFRKSRQKLDNNRYAPICLAKMESANCPPTEEMRMFYDLCVELRAIAKVVSSNLLNGLPDCGGYKNFQMQGEVAVAKREMRSRVYAQPNRIPPRSRLVGLPHASAKLPKLPRPPGGHPLYRNGGRLV